MTNCFLALGSNIGDRIDVIQKAERLIDAHIGAITQYSSYYETEPWGKTNQNKFINSVIQVDTQLSANVLIKETQRIERYLGKEKMEKYDPRVIDIDLLLYGDHVINELNLIVPHPQIQYRNFVLHPLSEIAPDFVHPILNQTISDLKDACKDDKMVYKV